eukprot:366457-Chlamydomonas_euryale.AAC.2
MTLPYAHSRVPHPEVGWQLAPQLLLLLRHAGRPLQQQLWIADVEQDGALALDLRECRARCACACADALL